jgi:hypothetical protein
MKMKKTHASRTVRRLGQVAFAAGGAALLVAGFPQTPAGAAGGPFPTTTTVTSSVATPVTGQAITFTAKVSAPSAPAGSRKAYGGVTFTVIAPDSTQINCDASNAPTLVGGSAQCAISAGLLSNATAYSVSVAYVDGIDSVYGASNATLLQTVAPGPTTTTVTTSVPSAASGQPVTFTATVVPTAPAQGTLTGSVKFTGVSRFGGCNGGSTVPVVGGMAQCTLSSGVPKTGSPFTVTGTYVGDPNFAGSSGQVVQNVHFATATLSLALSPNNCTGNDCTTGEGTPLTITVTATPTAPSVTDPAGPVVFSIIPAGTTTSLQCQGGNSIMLSGGQGTCTLPSGVPAVVYYTVTATLADPNFKAASSQLFLNSALGSTNTTLTTVPVDPGAGTTFVVVATVTQVQPSLIAPTGRVSMSVCSNITFACYGFPVLLQPDGTATMTVRGGQFPGGYTVYAHYLGDQNYFASTSPSAPLTVIRSTTTVGLISTANPSEDGSSVLITATVKGQADSSSSSLVGGPRGFVTFSVTGPNGSLTCAGGNLVKLKKNVATQGAVSCFLPAGSLTDPAAPGDTDYSVTATYGGDSNYFSSSSTYTQTVVPAVP